jgi:ribosome-binding factor A
VRNVTSPASQLIPSFTEVISMFRRHPRKDLQLCAQVREALYWVLGSAAGDESLAELQVVAVEPLPDASRLLVTLAAVTDAEVEQAVIRVPRAAKAIRAEIAASINRRKAPELVFRVARE